MRHPWLMKGKIKHKNDFPSSNNKVLILDVAVTFITKSTNFFNSEHSMFSRIWLSLLSKYNHTAGHTLSDTGCVWLSAVSCN